MPKRGENIYKRKDNRWEGRYIKNAQIGEKTRFGYVYGKTYREVKEKLLAQKTNDTCNLPTKCFGDICDEWLTVSRNRVKEATFVKYRNIITLHIKPRLGKYLPQEFNTVIVEAFSNSLLLKGLSSKTVKDILVLLKSILKYCANKEYDFFKENEIVYPKETKKEMDVLTREEQNVLTDYLLEDMDSVKFGVFLALCTGMRIGEICALKWKDICFDERVVRINKTMQRLQMSDGDKKTRVIVGETKSECSDRIVPLSNRLIMLCYKFYNGNSKAYVLTGKEHSFAEPRLLQYKIKKYAKDCNLSDLHFHTLRHTFATRCVEVGFEIKSLSEVLGHSSTKVTLDRYVHSSMELKRRNMEKLSAIGF